MKEIKKHSQGFTLIELLVVILIIGILAGIALPQYQMAVGKAGFSTLKSLTKSVQEAAQRHYMLYNTYEDLSADDSLKKLDIEIPKGSDCRVYSKVSQIMCCKEIFKERMCFYVNRENGLPLYCYTPSKDKKNKTRLLCQKETGERRDDCSGSCWYHY